jgi:3-methyladenine DNA glycosylase AlkD
MDLAATVLRRLVDTFEPAADPERAASMAAYMRDQFPFLGIPGPLQKSLGRQVLAGLARPDEAAVRAVALGCWALPEREYRYFACGYLRRYVKACSADLLPVVRELIVTQPWWDTVDALAAHVVGPLVLRYPPLVATMDAWVADEDMWLARTALLHQLTYKADTDVPRLFDYCLRQAGHRDFFIRKAIGWALREYAWTNPAAVRSFVAGTPLSGLSRREALKNLRD